VTGPAAIDTLAYLEAKFCLDSAGLNRRVLRRFRRRLEGFESPRLLDLGTGTGAMLRRCLAMNLKGSPLLVGIDKDADSLALARDKIAALPGHPGAMPAAAESPGTPRIRLLRLDLVKAALQKNPQTGLAAGSFDCVTAHALMDLLPLEPVIDWAWFLLRPGGLFYASLNYEGLTRFLPAGAHRDFEAALLEDYDRSMDERRVAGLSSGGSRSGSRLRLALAGQGFRLLACGRSDWKVRPRRLEAGCSGGEESTLLRTLLTMVYREALKRPDFRKRRSELESWYASRMREVRERRLGVRVRHLDVLGVKAPAPVIDTARAEQV
jgi:SAM-dependent methyltransferase